MERVPIGTITLEDNDCVNSVKCRHDRSPILRIRASISFSSTLPVYLPGLPNGVAFQKFCDFVHILDEHGRGFFYKTEVGESDPWDDVSKAHHFRMTRPISRHRSREEDATLVLSEFADLSGNDIESITIMFYSGVLFPTELQRGSLTLFWYARTKTLVLDAAFLLFFSPKRVAVHAETLLPEGRISFKLLSQVLLCPAGITERGHEFGTFRPRWVRESRVLREEFFREIEEAARKKRERGLQRIIDLFK